MNNKKQKPLNKSSIVNAYFKLNSRESISNVENWNTTVRKIKELYPQLSIKFIEEDLINNRVISPFTIHN